MRFALMIQRSTLCLWLCCASAQGFEFPDDATGVVAIHQQFAEQRVDNEGLHAVFSLFDPMVLPLAVLAHGDGVMQFPRFPKQVLPPGFVVGDHRRQGDPAGFLAVAPAQSLGANGLQCHAAANQIQVAEIPEHRVVLGQNELQPWAS